MEAVIFGLIIWSLVAYLTLAAAGMVAGKKKK
jgi:hypothetical protein